MSRKINSYRRPVYFPLATGRRSELCAIMDAAWLGVDQYNVQAFVNKLGSQHIVDAMSRAGQITFVLGDPRKRVEILNFSSTLFEAVPFTRDTYLIEGEP